MRLRVLTFRSKNRRDTSGGIDTGALPTRERKGGELVKVLHVGDEIAGTRNEGISLALGEYVISRRSERCTALQDIASIVSSNAYCKFYDRFSSNP